MRETQLKGVYEESFKGRKQYYTKALVPGLDEFDVRTARRDGDEYRLWDPKRSKLCAALHKGMSQMGIKPGTRILYLGAAHGYTPTFVSDIIGEEGWIVALDFAPEVVRDLVLVSERRPNMAPLLGDASQPQEYGDLVPKVDVVYQDLAQRDQIGIFTKNCERFLADGGFGLLVVKARSIDVTRKPKDIFKETHAELEKRFTVVDKRQLQPFEKDHAMFVVKN